MSRIGSYIRYHVRWPRNPYASELGAVAKVSSNEVTEDNEKISNRGKAVTIPKV